MTLRGQRPNNDGTMMLRCDERGYLYVDVAEADESVLIPAWRQMLKCTTDGSLMVGV